MQNITKTAFCTLLLPLVLTGCFSDPNTKASKEIDPPQVVKATAQQKVEVNGHNTELYVVNQYGYVLPYTVKVPGKSVAKTSLEYLVDGGAVSTILPKGMKGLLPKGTKVLGVKIKNNVATVDFSKQFRQYDVAKESKILSAITWTLTGFNNIKSVNLQVDGKNLEVMPKGKTPAQNLTRVNGINVEIANGVDISQSMPVTLYFLSQADDDSISYVPVTRLVNRSSNIGEMALKQLVQGPTENSHLIGPLDASTVVKDVQVSGRTITANFGKEILQYNDQSAVSKSAIRSIVLSLTQNTSGSVVKIMLDKKTTIGVMTKDGKNIDLPISRPKQINPSET
jgi:germination protein M